MPPPLGFSVVVFVFIFLWLNREHSFLPSPSKTREYYSTYVSPRTRTKFQSQSVVSGTEKLAQPVKYIPHKYEDLTLDPQHLCVKKKGKCLMSTSGYHVHTPTQTCSCTHTTTTAYKIKFLLNVHHFEAS